MTSDANSTVTGAPPIGTIMAYAGDLKKLKGSGWLHCDGDIVYHSQYPDLVERLGAIYGGDGVNDARLPDLRGQFLRGVDQGTGTDPETKFRYSPVDPKASYAGVGSVQESSIQNHAHRWDHFFNSITDQGNDITVHTPAVGKYGNFPAVATNEDGGVKPNVSDGKETRPKNVAVYWIIRAQ